jgi:UDP-2,3-diacylglucosamine pyrophosphatase LpxH
MPQKENDTWLIISDTHFGLHEMDKPQAQLALKNTLALLEDIQPSHVVINGDLFDVWMQRASKRHPKSIAAAQRQIEPLAKSIKKLAKSGTVFHFIVGNCDVFGSAKDQATCWMLLGITDPASINMTISSSFWQKDLGLLITHGHLLPAFALASSDAIRASSEPHKTFDTRTELPWQDTDPKKHLTITETITSTISYYAKSQPQLKALMQYIHVLLMNRFCSRFAALHNVEVRMGIFSHTHTVGVYQKARRFIMNTGTNGPQGITSAATMCIIRKGQPELWVTADEHGKGPYKYV